jgi:hypothetical protein
MASDKLLITNVNVLINQISVKQTAFTVTVGGTGQQLLDQFMGQTIILLHLRLLRTDLLTSHFVRDMLGSSYNV